ncbi:hypothetical protein Catovirus_1_689 [Catovirus CTV1]|uniref:Uncharacterized protein n=1 Tax=Catovirus CTV1 TaxID=1977631 RepID=A0A1V0SAB2_9VIRU|nr:hypothetical protein Catovirus_1_689 [Catovirus CTV1]
MYISWNLYNSQLFNQATSYLDCPIAQPHCKTQQEKFLNDIYSDKFYYKVNGVAVLPGLLLTIIALFAYLYVPGVILMALCKYTFIQLYKTEFGNLIFLGVIGFLIFCTIIYCLKKRSLIRQSHAQPILDLESNSFV